MVTSKPKNWKVYCKATFKSLCAILEDWNTNDEDVVRITTRIYYEGVFSCGLGDTGLISKNALNDPSNRTDDHCFSPQFVGRYIMDNPHIYLTDYNKFDEIFGSYIQTIEKYFSIIVRGSQCVGGASGLRKK